MALLIVSIVNPPDAGDPANLRYVEGDVIEVLNDADHPGTEVLSNLNWRVMLVEDMPYDEAVGYLESQISLDGETLVRRASCIDLTMLSPSSQNQDSESGPIDNQSRADFKGNQSRADVIAATFTKTRIIPPQEPEVEV